MRAMAACVFLFALALPAGAAEPAPDQPAYWGSPSVDGGKCCRTLGEVRVHIDRIDRGIVRLLAERGQYVHEAARFKKDKASVEAPARAEAVVQRAMRLAAADGLPPAVAEATYRAMMRAFLDYERSVAAGAPR